MVAELFMTNSLSYSVKALADYVGADIVGNHHITGEHHSNDKLVYGIATLMDATPNDLSFCANRKYKQELFDTGAACVLIHRQHFSEFGDKATGVGYFLIVDDPYLAYAKLSVLFADNAVVDTDSNIHPSVVIGENTHLGKNIVIGPNVVIGQDCHIGDDVCIGANVSIGKNCSIGTNSILYPNVSLYNDVQTGSDCIFHSMCVIGADGFGFAPSATGWQKIHQLGGVRIGSSVEVGAGTTIDRGALSHTEIGDGVKIDNQVQIAHNVKIGDNTAIAAAVAIAGSASIGKWCTIAGAVGIVGHISLADNVHITAMTMVTKSIHKAGSYSSGVPMSETQRWKRNAVRFNQLDDMAKQLKSLQKNG